MLKLVERLKMEVTYIALSGPILKGDDVKNEADKSNDMKLDAYEKINEQVAHDTKVFFFIYLKFKIILFFTKFDYIPYVILRSLRHSFLSQLNPKLSQRYPEAVTT
jgi:hypothetical protein